MAIVQVFHEEDNKFYTVSFTLKKGVLIAGSGVDVYYMVVETSMKKHDGTSFTPFLVQTLSDVPPGYSAATTFTALVQDYIAYFIAASGLGASSSSSLSSSSTSSSSSSTSSSTSSSSSTKSSSSSSSTSSSSSSTSSSSSYIERWSSSSSSKSSSSSSSSTSSSTSSSSSSTSSSTSSSS